jgi:LL-diaminopimelate aminotransferase
MTKRNRSFIHLSAKYLFPEINKRKKLFLDSHPDAKLISLGIGDTTEPLPPYICSKLSAAALALGTREGYTGYGPEQGSEELRKKIATVLYASRVTPSEIFISDGAKCDLGRLQLLFGPDVSIAIQDPSYPVYVDGSIIEGVREIAFMPCTPSNGFFPDLASTPRTDLIYFCSPNNPTGHTATRQQLTDLVLFAKRNKSIVIFDAAYANYIMDPSVPKSIYEIDGADEVAIELGSFSKLAGFTGVRLGWSIVPEKLRYEDGSSVKADWSRLMSTLFNGASNIAQQGGCAVLDQKGMQEVAALTSFYMENTRIIREALLSQGHATYGGNNAPYLWVHFPGRNSWDVFQEFMEQYHIVTTPGSGFGPAGEGFIRLTAFGHRNNVVEAMKRLGRDASSLHQK